MELCKACKKELDNAYMFCPYCGEKQCSDDNKRRSSRRDNGTGTICKRSDIKARPYMAVTPSSSGKSGVNGREVIGYYATRREARIALDEYRRAPTTKFNITLTQLHDEWMPSYYRDLSPQTIDNYNAAWAKLTPLYDERFKDLRTGQYQDIIDALCEPRNVVNKKTGKTKTVPPMSRSSLSKIKILLTLLYTYAMKNDIVTKNYAEFLTLPKASQKDNDCFGTLDLIKLERACEAGIKYADFILCMCYTGFRITEFLSLDKFSYRSAENALVGGMKTDAGRDRPIPVHPKIQKYVDAQLAKGGETIFCKDDGKPFSSNYFRKYCYAQALEAAGIEYQTPHATRRTFATLLSASGAKEEDITRLMGHTDFKLTTDVYIKQSVDTLRVAIEKMA